MIIEFERPEVRVFAAERSRREQILPAMNGPKRVLRYLWLVRATEPHAVFTEEGERAVNVLRTHPIVHYTQLPDVLQSKLETPYQKPETHRRFRIFLNDRVVELPCSAESLTIINRNGRTRQVSDFRSAVRRKIASDFPWQRLGTFEGYGEVTFEEKNEDKLFALLDEVAEDDAEIFTRALEAYASIDNELLDFLGEVIKRIKRLPSLEKENSSDDLHQKVSQILKRDKGQREVRHRDPEVYYGRDSRWLFLARKAQQLGSTQRNILRYLIASRNILESDIFTDYVLTHNIPFNAYHIDIAATQASAVRKVLDILACEKGELPTEEEIERRGRFVATATLPRTQRLFPERDPFVLGYYVGEKIECQMPGDTPNLFRVYRNGIPEPQFTPSSTAFPNVYIEELKAWAIEQAVVRHFLPKLLVAPTQPNA